MITPNEIKQKAERKYTAFLQASVQNEPFFSLQIRFRKAKASDDYLALRQWVGELLAGSKAERGFGYEVALAERESRRYGRQSLPSRIAITTQTDFLRLIGKVDEFRRWETAVTHTLAQFPQLQNWLAQYPQRVLPHLAIWDDLLAVCAYFVAHPLPDLYLRELPILVHTKFIEENQAILRQLLDVLLPPDVIHTDESRFERRFGLRYDEPQIRLRFLDNNLRHKLGWPTVDLSVRLSDCAGLVGLNGRIILIVENKMTFLTLPPVKNGIAIWGKGFQVELLRDITWLADCVVWYWGDLDAQGFAILAQLRRYWPQTRSFLMDAATLEKYRMFIVDGTPVKKMELAHLDEGETAVYQQLVTHNWRLEQERIRQEDVIVAIKNNAEEQKSRG
ncbi:MAG: DUF2399 domain-containing protein [Chloroflexi bacterium]|nr:DUF2399 domain-containing protein [Chloroflexota bacterium]